MVQLGRADLAIAVIEKLLIFGYLLLLFLLLLFDLFLEVLILFQGNATDMTLKVDTINIKNVDIIIGHRFQLQRTAKRLVYLELQKLTWHGASNKIKIDVQL